MSLKAIHIVFVAASILLAFGFGAWSLLRYKGDGMVGDLIYGIGSIIAGIGLIVYGKLILKKLKHISYL